VTGSPPGNWGQWRRQLSPTDYDERWRRIEASGANPHGEADFVFSYGPRSVLDAGCGTGRVAIELARRGLDVVGTDLDQDMISAASAKAPELTWVHSDLSKLDLPIRFDAVVLAGNVIPYLAGDRRQAAVVACARHLAPGGRLIAGFQLRQGWPSLADYDGWCHSAGLAFEARYATWDRHPFTDVDSYAVSVHIPVIPRQVHVGASVDQHHDDRQAAASAPVAVGSEPAEHLVEVGRPAEPAVHEQHRVAGIGTSVWVETSRIHALRSTAAEPTSWASRSITSGCAPSGAPTTSAPAEASLE
jgi:SAM-dependent methyltransferase